MSTPWCYKIICWVGAASLFQPPCLQRFELLPERVYLFERMVTFLDGHIFEWFHVCSSSTVTGVLLSISVWPSLIALIGERASTAWSSMAARRTTLMSDPDKCGRTHANFPVTNAKISVHLIKSWPLRIVINVLIKYKNGVYTDWSLERQSQCDEL